MDNIQRQLAEAKRKDLVRQQRGAKRSTEILTIGRKRGDKILGAGKESQKPFYERLEKDKEYFSGKQSQDYSRLGAGTAESMAEAPSEEPDQVGSVEEEIEQGRRLEQEKRAGRTEEKPAAIEATEGGEGEEEGSVKGRWNKLQKQLNKIKEEAKKEEAQKGMTQQAFQALQKQAQELVRQGWSAVHETVEDLALSFIDLTILTGPLCGLVLFIRILGFAIWPPISVKGVEVSLFPWFSLPGDFARVKSLLALIISGIFWTIIIAIIYAFNNPFSTLAHIIGL